MQWKILFPWDLFVASELGKVHHITIGYVVFPWSITLFELLRHLVSTHLNCVDIMMRHLGQLVDVVPIYPSHGHSSVYLELQLFSLFH